mgnify:CR=1 FL=1
MAREHAREPLRRRRSPLERVAQRQRRDPRVVRERHQQKLERAVAARLPRIRGFPWKVRTAALPHRSAFCTLPRRNSSLL